MEENRYELYGYLNRWPNKEFVFLMPLFRWDNMVYRSEIDEARDSITGFSLMDGAFSIYDPDDARNFTCKVGEPAIYMYSFREEIFCGERYAVCVQLLMLIRYLRVSPLDQYDMFYFMGISAGIEASLDLAVQELGRRGIGITKKNFLRPWDVRINVEQLVHCMRLYSILLSVKGCVLPIDSFQTPGIEGDGMFRLGKFVIDKSELKGRFDELIEMDRSPLYRDLVVCSFLMNGVGHYAIGSRELRFRVRPLTRPISEDQQEMMEVVYRNSQSAVSMEKNALELAAEVGARVDGHAETGHRMSAKARDADTAQTFFLAEKVKALV